jgi:hypothetical protein
MIKAEMKVLPVRYDETVELFHYRDQDDAADQEAMLAEVLAEVRQAKFAAKNYGQELTPLDARIFALKNAIKAAAREFELAKEKAIASYAKAHNVTPIQAMQELGLVSKPAVLEPASS